MDNAESSMNNIGEFRELCKKLKNNEIRVKDMHLSELLNVIADIYDSVGDL